MADRNRGRNPQGRHGRRRPKGSFLRIKNEGGEFHVEIPPLGAQAVAAQNLFAARLELEKKRLAREYDALDKKEVAKFRLFLAAEFKQEGHILIALSCLDEHGQSVVKEISYYDSDEGGMVKKYNPSPASILWLKLPKQEKPRKVTFFLPEYPEDGIAVDVPAKQGPPPHALGKNTRMLWVVGSAVVLAALAAALTYGL